MKSKHQMTCQVERYFRERQLLKDYLPFSASTLWRKVRAGSFPTPVKLGPSITAWRESEVAEWLNNQHVSRH
jgi:predicted DNA-binding transcriptional regulator AlpA